MNPCTSLELIRALNDVDEACFQYETPIWIKDVIMCITDGKVTQDNSGVIFTIRVESTRVILYKFGHSSVPLYFDKVKNIRILAKTIVNRIIKHEKIKVVF